MTDTTELPEELLTYDQAVALLADGDSVHTFLQGPLGMLIGADWSREKILALLRDTDRREVTGPQAQAMGHGLAAWRGDEPVFIETAAATAEKD
jgi:hypothetical protein